MQSIKVLEMLEAGRIEELKALLQDEIYQESLKNRPNAKKRYTAMKKYFGYVNQSREVLQKPCEIVFEDKQYTCFTNSWSLVMTTEDTGEIELFDQSSGRYPEIGRLIRFDGLKKKIDFGDVIDNARSKGYKLNKTEVGPDYKYVMLYDGTYYKVGLLDITYRIIDNGEPAMTYHPYDKKSPLTFQNDLGLGIIMPVYIQDEASLNEKIIIEVEDK